MYVYETLEDFARRPWISLLIGTLCGFIHVGNLLFDATGFEVVIAGAMAMLSATILAAGVIGLWERHVAIPRTGR